MESDLHLSTITIIFYTTTKHFFIATNCKSDVFSLSACFVHIIHAGFYLYLIFKKRNYEMAVVEKVLHFSYLSKSTHAGATKVKREKVKFEGNVKESD